MNDAQNHIIKSQEFVVDIEDVNRADEFFRKIKHLQYDRIEEELEKVLSKYSEEDVTFLFDKIELDLGTVSDLNFEQEVVFKIEEALIEFFRNNISANGKLKTGKRISGQKNNIEQLRAFLTSGSYSWNKSNKVGHHDILKDLIQNKPEELKNLILKIGSKESVRKRLIYQYNDELLNELIKVAKPIEGQLIVDYKRIIEKENQEEQRLNIGHDNFRMALWEIVLAYLFFETGNYYSKKHFLTYYFKKVSAKYAIQYKELLEFFNSAITEFRANFNTDIAFAEIVEELLTNDAQNNIIEKIPEAQISSSVNLLFDHVFQHGFFPQESKIKSFSSFNELLENELASNKTRTIKYFSQIINENSKRERLPQFINSKNINFIIKEIDAFEIKTRLETLDRIGQLTNRHREYGRIIYPFIESNKGRIVIESIHESKEFEREVLAELFEKLLKYPGLHVNNLREYTLFLTENLGGKVADYIKEFSENNLIVESNSQEDTNEEQFDFEFWAAQLKMKLKDINNVEERLQMAIRDVSLLFNESGRMDDLLEQLATNELGQLDISQDQIVQIIEISRSNKAREQLKSLKTEIQFSDKYNGKIEELQRRVNDLPKVEQALHDENRLDSFVKADDNITIEGLKYLIAKNSSIYELVGRFIDDELDRGILIKSNARFFEAVQNLLIRGIQFELGSDEYSAFIERENIVLRTNFKWLDNDYLKSLNNLIKDYYLSQKLETDFSLIKKSSFDVSTEIQVHIKEFLDQTILSKDDYNNLSFEDSLSFRIDAFALANNLHKAQVIEMLFKENLNNVGFKEVLLHFPQGIQEIVIDRLHQIIEKIENQEVLSEDYLKSIVSEIQSFSDDFEGLNGPERNLLREEIVKDVESKLIIDTLKSLAIETQYIESTKEKNIEKKVEQVEIKILQHWLLHVEREFENWKHLDRLNYKIQDSIRELAIQHNLSNKVVRNSILNMLKTRVILNNIEQAIVDSILQEFQHAKSKGEIVQNQKNLNTDLIAYYLTHNRLPNWMSDTSAKFLVSLVGRAYQDEKNSLIQRLRKAGHSLSIYNNSNFLDLVFALDSTELHRFYNNISLAEEFIKHTLQNLYGVSQSGIKTLRKRLLLLGLENDFRVDNSDFFKRLLFISNRLFKLDEKELKSFLYYQVNSFKTKSSRLLFIAQEFPNLDVIEVDFNNEMGISQTNVSFFDLLLKNQILTSSEKEIFENVLLKIDFNSLSQSGSFKKTLLNTETRMRLLDLMKTDLIEELLKEGLTAQNKLQLNEVLKRLALLENELSIKQFKGIRSALFDNLLKFFAVNRMAHLNPKDWISLFYRIVYTEIGVEAFQDTIDKRDNFDLFRKDQNELEKILKQVQLNMIDEEIDERDNSNEEISEKEIYIENAGLVILAPYFSRLFDRLGLTDAGQFKSEKEQGRAVNLVQYMITGEKSFNESDLALNKVICGLDANTPIAILSSIPKEEIEIMESLLNAVKSQWTVMKNTTIESLRETFLIREGKLIEEEDRFRLLVSPKSFDMLLDSLPWNINLIKLSWMKKSINVEWK